MVESTEVLNKKCIFVLGPTASGKSAWALEQAQKFNGSIVNVDSIQFYKKLIVGSAAPTAEEKKIVPHCLYSYVEAPEVMTAGKYLTDFYDLMKTDIKFPLFIVGGTGFYIQALEKGMFDIEPIPSDCKNEIESELKSGGARKLYAELIEKDPNTKIHINDHYRLVRALEIIRGTGKIPSELNQNTQKNKNEFPYPYIKVGFDFEKPLYVDRVNARTKKMIADGIIEETRGFYDEGFKDWVPLQSVGYRETLEYLVENKNKEWLLQSINQSTLQLIKKQKTWFKRDKAVLWSNQSASVDQFLS